MAGTSISLPTDMEQEIEKIMWNERKTKSEVIRDALIPYLESKKNPKNSGARARRRTA